MNIELIVDGRKVNAEVEAEITSWGNDGIGPYEFWGARGYDHGRDYVDEFEITDLTVRDSKTNQELPELVGKVRDYLYEHKYEEIREWLQDHYEEPEPPEYEREG